MITPLLATLLSAGLACVAFLRGGASARAFGLLGAANALWNWGILLGGGAGAGIWAIHLGDLLIPPCLFLLLERATGRSPRAAGIASLLSAAGAVFLVAHGEVSVGWGRALAFYLGGSLVIVLGRFFYEASISPSRVGARRLRALGTGLAVAGFGGLSNFGEDFGLPAWGVGSLANAIGTVWVGAAVLRYGIFDLGRLLAAAVADLTLGILLAAWAWLAAGILDRAAGIPPVAGAVLALALALSVVGRVRWALAAFLERLLSAERVDEDAIRAKALHALAAAGDERAVGEALREAARTLSRADASFYRAANGDLIRIAGSIGPARLAGPVPRSSHYEVEVPASVRSAEPRAGAVIPAGRGLLLLLEKPRGLPYFEADRLILADLATAAGLVLARILEARRRAEAEEAALAGKLAAAVAHDILNPVGAIAGAAEVLLRRGSDPEFAGIVRSEAARVERICRDFLDYGRPFPLEKRLCDMRVVAERAAEGIRLANPALAVEVSGEARGEADEDALYRLVANLLRNAAEAGAARARVTVTPGPPPGLSVEDDGPGVSSEDAERIWIPFRTTKPGGTGLGLPLVRRIAEAHGGQAQCGKSEWGGARFSITLSPL